MLTCKQITEQSSDYLDGERPLTRRLAVWMHLMMCAYCRRYLRYMRAVTTVLANTKQQVEHEEQVDKIMARVKAERD